MSSWAKTRTMVEPHEIKEQYELLGKEIAELSKYIDSIRNDEEYEHYSERFSGCLERLHDLRIVTDGLHFRNRVR